MTKYDKNDIAFIFDMDGTLLHLPINKKDVDDLRLTLNGLFKKYGIDTHFRPVVDSIKKALKTMEVIGYRQEEIRKVKETAFKLVDNLEITAAKKAIPRKGVNNVLKELSKYKLGLVSNNSKKTVFYGLKSSVIPSELFSVIISRESVSNVKPSPEPLINAIHTIFTIPNQKRVFYIGDHIYDLICAKKTQVTLTDCEIVPIGISGGKCRTDDLVNNGSAKYIIKSISELLNINVA